jgi:hypothetical protein
MNPELDPKTVTCNAGWLALIFDVTTRNIAYWVEKGLPTLSRGKSGRGHTFKVPVAFHWIIGMQVCAKWDVALPPPLETMLISYGLDIGDSFAEWYEYARKLAHDGGFSDARFDSALTFVMSNGLIRGRRPQRRTWRN